MLVRGVSRDGQQIAWTEEDERDQIQIASVRNGSIRLLHLLASGPAHDCQTEERNATQPPATYFADIAKITERLIALARWPHYPEVIDLNGMFCIAVACPGKTADDVNQAAEGRVQQVLGIGLGSPGPGAEPCPAKDKIVRSPPARYI
jgi:hypothetical protein